MKLAIVGTSHIKTEEHENEIRKLCMEILKEYVPIETTVITGGAKGVDTIAQNTALILGFAVKPIFPIGFGKKANLERNKVIAKECDNLYCITTTVHNKQCYHHKPTQNHEKTAGCYTMNEALRQGKKCRLYVIGKNNE